MNAKSAAPKSRWPRAIATSAGSAIARFGSGRNPLPEAGASKPRRRRSAIGPDGLQRRPVAGRSGAGCRIDHQGGSPRDGSGGNVEVCN